MKKTIAFLLLLSMLISAFTGCNSSSEKSNDNTSEDTGIVSTTDENRTKAPENDTNTSDFEYDENESGGITITKYIGTDTEVVIPEKINGKSVTEIGDLSFCKNQSIVSVTMPDSVTALGTSAFLSCPSLTTVTLSPKLTSIGEKCFYECEELSSVTLPETITTIGDYAFNYCNIKHIKIPKSLTDWGKSVFLGSMLETVEFEEGLLEIGRAAFQSTEIKQIVIPDSVQSIGEAAFAWCEQLESVALGEGVRLIDEEAFYLSDKIVEIIIPKSVESLSSTAFLYCDSLKAIKFEGDAPEGFTMEAAMESISYTPGAIPSFTVYYHEGAEGFTSPEWNGFPSEIW